MYLSPPQGSKISVTTDGADDIIRIPQASRHFTQYFAAAFILFWLGGWYAGFSSALSLVLSGEAPAFAMAFMIFWLGAWTAGGFLAAYMLYRMVRPTIPESLRLRLNGIAYDSGISPYQIQFNYANRRDAWKSMFQRRVLVEVD
jgi:hypothetical protein